MTIGRIRFSLAALVFGALPLLASPALALETGAPEANQPRSRLQNLTERASELAMHAMGLIGIRYKYGGGTPEHGLDCSGLVRHVFQEAWGMTLPRTSEEISRVGQRIDRDELQPGDLVFYNTLRRSFSHVGIYLGDQKFIHAPSSGGHVRIESMDVAYWKKRFNGARRIKDPQPAPVSVATPATTQQTEAAASAVSASAAPVGP